MTVDKGLKVAPNEDSNDSVHPMIIDEGEEARSVTDESVGKSKRAIANPSGSHLTTINSLVEKEICKTLSETEKRLSNQTAHADLNASLERSGFASHPQVPPPPPPPPLVMPMKSHSPAAAHFSYPSHSQPPSNKGSITRGTPISSSTGANKPINVDTAPAHPHQYHSPRNEPSPLKSPKILDRNIEQKHLLQQQQQQQQQQHRAAYMRHYTQQQQQQQSSMGQYLSSQHKASSNKMDSSNPNTFETLRADYVTSKYLTSAAVTHSPNQER